MTARKTPSAEAVSCACGCGARLDPRDRKGRPRRFILAHVGRVYGQAGRIPKAPEPQP